MADNRTENVPLDSLALPGTARLGSYPDLESALAQIPGAAQAGVVFERAPAGCKYALLMREFERSGEAAGSVPIQPGLAIDWRTAASGVVRTAVLAAVDGKASAREQIEPLLRCSPLPALVTAPADIGENVALICAVDGTLKVGAGARLGFNYHWLREVAAGRISGDLGVAIGGDAEASLDMALAGSFLTVAMLDAQGRLRLRVSKRWESSLTPAGRISVGAQARAPLPEKPEALVTAILGVHEGQWLESLARALKEAGPESIAARLGAAAQALARFFELWDQLDAGAAAAIWRAAGKTAELSSAREWIHRIATELRDPGRLKSALAEAIESAPDFAGSAAGGWIEAVSGSLLAPVTSAEEYEKLVRAAELADKLFSEQGLAEVLGQLKRYAARELGLPRLERALQSAAAFRRLDQWVQDRLRELFGEIASDADAGRAAGNLGAIAGLAKKIYEQALAAVEKKYSAELSYRYERAATDTALLDCSFASTAGGLAAWRRAVAGDFSQALAGSPSRDVRLHRGTLTHGLRRQSQIELLLPFLDRKQWGGRWEALAKAEIEGGDDGRVVVYTVNASDRLYRKNACQSALALAGTLVPSQAARSQFTLTYTDRRELSAAQARSVLAPALLGYGFDAKVSRWLETVAAAGRIEASLTLSIPGSLVACWLRAPGEGDPQFFPAYAAVSVAVQQAMRKWLPYAYFSDLDRYGELGAAFPLIVYQSTRPFPGRPPSEFTYDIMSPDSTEPARRSTARSLMTQLRRIEQLLVAAGRKRLARFYAPEQAATILAQVQRRPRLLNSLLVADAFFVDSLVRLGTRGRELSGAVASDPRTAARELANFSAEFVTAFHRKLRRLYAGESFVALGSLILVEATRALGAALNEDSAAAGVLRLTVTAEPAPLEQTFVNAAFRP